MAEPITSPNKNNRRANIAVIGVDDWERLWPDSRRPYPYEDYAPSGLALAKRERPPRFHEHKELAA